MIPVLPPPQVMSHAMAAVDRFGDGRQILFVVDMSEPNVDRRMWVIDLKTGTVVLQTQVAHGSGSDPKHTGIAQQFGNRDGSLMTSLGAYRVSDSYQGHSGLSYQLVGLSPSNSNAEERNIMLHRAPYVTPDRVGWSEGCLAISLSAFVDLQHRLGDLSGALIWVDGPGVVAPSPLWRYSWLATPTCSLNRLPAEPKDLTCRPPELSLPQPATANFELAHD